MRRLAPWLRRFARTENGSSTVEFVIAVPIVLAMLFTSVDFGATMLRQIFLDRAVDIAVRQVRLGAVSAGGIAEFRQLICDGTILLPDCENAITIEMRPIDTDTWAGLNAPAQCINREEDIAPVVGFDPGSGDQELMLIRVCVVADPFIDATGLVLGLPRDSSGAYHVVSRGAFANEPA